MKKFVSILLVALVLGTCSTTEAYARKKTTRKAKTTAKATIIDINNTPGTPDSYKDAILYHFLKTAGRDGVYAEEFMKKAINLGSFTFDFEIPRRWDLDGADPGWLYYSIPERQDWVEIRCYDMDNGNQMVACQLYNYVDIHGGYVDTYLRFYEYNPSEKTLILRNDIKQALKVKDARENSKENEAQSQIDMLPLHRNLIGIKHRWFDTVMKVYEWNGSTFVFKNDQQCS